MRWCTRGSWLSCGNYSRKRERQKQEEERKAGFGSRVVRHLFQERPQPVEQANSIVNERAGTLFPLLIRSPPKVFVNRVALHYVVVALSVHVPGLVPAIERHALQISQAKGSSVTARIHKKAMRARKQASKPHSRP